MLKDLSVSYTCMHICFVLDFCGYFVFYFSESSSYLKNIDIIFFVVQVDSYAYLPRSCSKGEINDSDMDKECMLSLSRSITLPISCHILTLIVDAALRNLQAASCKDSMLENGSCYAENFAANLLWDLCNMTERLLLQGVEHRSCAIGFLLPIILKAFVSLHSLEISVHGNIFILSR